MIRQAIDNASKTQTFKYNGEEWKITLFNDRVDLEVDANGSWTSLSDIVGKFKNLKQALKATKKEIDSFEQYK